MDNAKENEMEDSNYKNDKNKKVIVISSIIIAVVTILLQIGLAFFVTVNQSDEAWNFQNIYKTYLGMTMYKDANVIITPLFFIIGKWILQIFSPNIFSYRIYDFIIASLLHVLIFAIYYKKSKSIVRSILYFVLSTMFTYVIIAGMANYNTLALVFVLIGILYFITRKKSKYYHYVQGFIVFLIFFTKQNVGMCYGLGILVYELIYWRKNYICNNIKKFITFAIPLAIYLIYMYSIGNLYNFINYCFLGMADFLSNLEITSYILLPILGFILVVLFMKFIKKRFVNFDYEDYNFMMVIGFFNLFFSIPIANQYHVFLGILPLLMLILCLLDSFFLNEIIVERYENIIAILCIVIYIISVTAILLKLTYVFKDYEYIEDSEVFKYIALEDDTYYEFIEMREFILNEEENGNEVIFLSVESVLTNLYFNNFHGDLDLLLKGNLGKDGEEKIIEELAESDENVLYLVKSNNEDYFRQYCLEIVNYIKENFEEQGKFLDYTIYSNSR